jgi:phosphopantetheinyl transferase
MNVYWLEQTEADVPIENDWLSENEASSLNRMRFAKRRADWRLGRWTAKHALSVYLDLPAHPEIFKKMDIRPAQSGAPRGILRQPTNWSHYFAQPPQRCRSLRRGHVRCGNWL